MKIIIRLLVLSCILADIYYISIASTKCKPVEESAHFSDLTTYLTPYTSKEKLDKVMQKDLSRFLVKEPRK